MKQKEWIQLGKMVQPDFDEDVPLGVSAEQDKRISPLRER